MCLGDTVKCRIESYTALYFGRPGQSWRKWTLYSVKGKCVMWHCIASFLLCTPLLLDDPFSIEFKVALDSCTQYLKRFLSNFQGTAFVEFLLFLSNLCYVMPMFMCTDLSPGWKCVIFIWFLSNDQWMSFYLNWKGPNVGLS